MGREAGSSHSGFRQAPRDGRSSESGSAPALYDQGWQLAGILRISEGAHREGLTEEIYGRAENGESLHYRRSRPAPPVMKTFSVFCSPIYFFRQAFPMRSFRNP